MNLLLSILKGFGAGGSLIVAIGAQNAFVIRQGLRREHLLLTALICSIIDAILIAFGVLGLGSVIEEYPLFINITKYFAVLFLVVYGALSLKAALQANSLKSDSEDRSLSSAKKTVFSLLALSLLNPHVYLDTVILLGSIASQHPAHEQLYFALGAMSASFLWFFTITFGAHLLAPLFQKQNSWRIIDGIIAVTMWVIAFSLWSF